ncbi:MAG: adenylate/guanylate cyclase domain-containing protein [Ramlibacter sp.]
MPAPWTETPFSFAQFTKVITVLDVVESVRLMEQDQHDFIQRWHYFVEQAREHVLPQHGGRMLKSLGDGLMLEFADAQGCVKASFALQELCRQGNEGRRPDQQMHLRVGAHLCEFVSDQYDIYGTDVNLTARIATLAGPGETVVTASLRDRLTAGLDADIEDLGECHLKHVHEPIRAYRVGPVGHKPVIERGSGIQLDLRPTIAVIPFAIRGGEAGHEMLGEALADEVIAALSRTSELHVISRLSTTVFRERQEAVEDIRTHLNASYILSGTCRTTSSHLSLFVELIDVTTRHVVWADSLKGAVQGIFAVDDALIPQLVAAISSAVMTAEVGRSRAHSLPNLQGYTLMLGAVALMHRNAPTDFNRAKEMLDHLAERSRRHPIPHAWLAKWHVLRVQQGWSEDPAREAQLALDCTKRALDNEPDCALALTVDGLVRTNLLRDTDTALLRYQRAIDLNPNESLAWLLKGTLHAFKGDGEEAVANTTRALSLSPLDPLRYFYYSLAATAALSAKQHERALALARESLRANRTHTSTWRVMAISQVHLGQIEDARASAAELLRLQPGLTVSNYLTRHPSGQYGTGQMWADAMRQAGVPV